jgi:fatty-acyl-CoA synthase
MAMPAPTSRHFAHLTAEMAGRQPERPAIVAGDRTLTYAELDEQVRAMSGALQAAGVAKGTTVGLLCTNRWEFLPVAYGAMRLGARVAAYNSWAKEWDLEYMVAHSRAEVVVSVDRFRTRSYVETMTQLVPELAEPVGTWRAGRFPQLREVVFIGDSEIPAGARRLDDLLAQGVAPEEVDGDDGDDAFVLYTSGSSARPKAVPLRHGSGIENGFSIGECMKLGPDDRVWLAAPLFWSYGAINAVPATLTHGACLVLQEGFEPEAALDLIERHRCTAIYTLPNMTSSLAGHPSFDPARTSSVRTGLTIGGAEDVRRAAEVIGAREICNIYGSTETYGNCAVTPADLPYETRMSSQGPPLPGFTLRIQDPGSGAELPAGEVGEILVRGHLTRGYLKEDGVSVDPVLDEDGWYRTGDLAHLDADGMLHFASRATEMIKTGGINVAPKEVEELVAMYPGVHEVAVVGAPDESAGQVVAAFVVPVAGGTVDPAELRAWCAERVAGFKVPRRVTLVDELPKTVTGKLARRVLEARAADAAEATTPSGS